MADTCADHGAGQGELYALLLQHFRTPRPGFQISQIALSGYSRGEIRAGFHHLRREQLLEAKFATDASGKRYAGWVVSLTPLGSALAEARAR